VHLDMWYGTADDEVPRGQRDPERSPCALTAQIQLILLTPYHTLKLPSSIDL
jgi:hypothetical protein